MLSGCTSPTERSLIKAQARERITQSCVESVNDLKAHRLRLRDTAFAIDVDDTSECLENQARRATAVLFEIPGSRKRTWQIGFKSRVKDDSVFALKVQLLGSKLNILKEVPFGSFKRRGNSYTETIFVDSSDAVRYLLIRSDGAVVERYDRVYRMRSRVRVTPLSEGFFAYTYGTDGRYAINYSPFGEVSVEVKAYETGPLSSP